MLRRNWSFLTAAAAATGTAGAAPTEGSSATTTTSSSGTATTISASSRHTMHQLYRRLLKTGEEGPMMQHCLSVHTLPESLAYGMNLLNLHKGLTDVDAKACQLSWLHPIKRFRLACSRRYYAWNIFALRLKLRGQNALSDALVYTLFLVVCVLLYEIYRACRVGVNRAVERYSTMAIPIMQTFDAMEASQERKKILRSEMEEDIVRTR